MNLTLKTVLDYISADTKITLYLNGTQICGNVPVYTFPFNNQANQFSNHPVKEIKPTDFLEMTIYLTDK